MTVALFFVVLGWLATSAYLTGHIYLATQPHYKERLYYSLNLFGAVAFILSSTAIASWQSVIINIFWAIISLAALSGRTELDRFPLSRWWLIGPSFLAALAGLFVMISDVRFGSDIMGWAGTALYIFGYYLFASKSIKPWQFLTYNTIAAVILLPIYALDINWPAFTLSFVWSLISLYGLWVMRKAKTRIE